MKDTKETVEFFTPNMGLDVAPYIEANNKQGIHHVGRYTWAAQVLPGRNPKRVLDIACGSGYGSYMLARALPNSSVTGGDYDERAVTLARGRYSSPNLSYAQADMVRWVSGAGTLGKFDAVVSFDTIEHLLHREIALIRICDNLAADGALLLSTPCGHQETKLNPAWEHHKIEYSHTDLHSLLSRFFRKVIHPQHPDFPGRHVWDNINDGAMRYLTRMNPLICLDPVRSSKP